MTGLNKQFGDEGEREVVENVRCANFRQLHGVQTIKCSIILGSINFRFSCY